MLGAIASGGMAGMWQQISYTARHAVGGVSTAAPAQDGISPASAAATGAAAAAAGAAIGPSELPFMPEGFGPVDLAARTRLQFPGLGVQLSEEDQEWIRRFGSPFDEDEEDAIRMPWDTEEDEENGVSGVKDAKSPAEIMDEEKCETCAKRKYQDGSDDPGVSFKFATKVDPKAAQAAVRGHEMEHVVRERAKAKMEGRKVVSQSVTYHTGICPECGKFYIAGGTTRTVTAADKTKENLSKFADQGKEAIDLDATA